VCLPAVLPLQFQVVLHLFPRAMRTVVRLVSRPLVPQVLLRVVLPVRRLVSFRTPQCRAQLGAVGKP
jgi:hypothetical protein